MILDELKDLMTLFVRREKGALLPLKEIADRTQGLLTALEAPSSEPEIVQIEEAIRIELQEICKKWGISEEELQSRAANRQNFAVDEWQILEQMEQRIALAGKQVQKKLYPYVSQLKRSKPHPGRPHKPKKGEWLKP